MTRREFHDNLVAQYEEVLNGFSPKLLSKKKKEDLLAGFKDGINNTLNSLRFKSGVTLPFSD